MPIFADPKSIEAELSLGDTDILISVDENFCAIGKECAVLPHAHTHYELFYLDNGSLDLLIDEKLFHLKKSDLLLFSPGEYHCKPETTISEDAIQYTIRFRISKKQDLESKQKSSPLLFFKVLTDTKSILIANKKIKDSFLSIQDELSKKDFAYKNSIRAHLYIIMTEFSRLAMSERKKEVTSIENSKSDRRSRLERFFSSRHTEKVTLNDLGKYLNFSTRQAARIVFAEFNKNFVAVLNETRVIHAKHELIYTEKTLGEIALSCGFQSYEYFAHCFKKETGITPMKFKKLNKETLKSKA